MNRQRIIAILETYRPGEGLEADPEVREALELATRDPELAEIRDAIKDFDLAFGAKLREVPVPASLQGQILAAARPGKPAGGEGRKVISWLHPAAFAAAASIVILLALSFTFWNRPATAPLAAQAPADPEAQLMATAHQLYASLNPSFRGGKGPELVQYLQQHGGFVPGTLPSGFSWDKSFACDVVEINGTRVSIICFMAPDNSKSMHLFTFDRSAFPGLKSPGAPRIHSDKHSCCATWLAGEEVHVLFSDKGEENLRAVLDI
jgi:hypothetical protein